MSDQFDPDTMVWVFDKAGLKDLLTAIETCEEVVTDLETTALDEHAVFGGIPNEGFPAKVVLQSLTLPQPDDADPEKPSTWLVPLSHPDSPFCGQWKKIFTLIFQWIRKHRKKVVNQNIKFDARWINAHTGVDISSQIDWCSQTGAHLIDETRTTKLKERVPLVFNVPRWDDDVEFTEPGQAERTPLFDLGVYAARDTYWTWRWANRQRYIMNVLYPAPPETPEEYEDARLGRLMTWVSMPTVRTLTQIEQRGMKLDIAWVRKQLAEHLEAADVVRSWLEQRYPQMDPRNTGQPSSFAPTANWFQAWTALAVTHGDLRVAAFTDGGKPQWSKSVLLRQERTGSEVASKLLEFRSHVKKAEYLKAWLGFVTPANTIHPSYNIGSVKSGRLSSSAPNAQQITATLKAAYPARIDYCIVEFDYSQVEMRVAAFISRCKPMIEAFQRGDDLHRILAAAITGKDLADITAEERQAGKAGNFGLLFHMSAFGFMNYAENVYGVSFTEQEAQLIHRTFFETWEGIGPWHVESIATAHRTGQIVSPLGRIRRLPDIYSHNRKFMKQAERQAVNSPVQGMASDICQIAAALVAGTMPGSTKVEGCELIATVHDSLVAEVEISRWREISKEVMHRMTHDVLTVLKKLNVNFDVPLAVEAKAGLRWGTGDLGTIQG